MVDIQHIDIQTVDHCNFHCKGCDHYAPLKPKRFYQADDYIPHLQILKRISNIGWINISGGEPTLHPRLNDFVQALTVLRLPLRLITNCHWLSERGLEKFAGALSSINAIWLTLHPELNKTERELDYWIDLLRQRYPNILAFKKSLPELFYRSTSFSEMKMRTKLCHLSRCLNVLADGRLAHCSIIATAPDCLTSNSFERSRHSGYLNIGAADEQSLREWLQRMPACCDYCLYGSDVVEHA